MTIAWTEPTEDAPLGSCKHGPIEYTDEGMPYCVDCDHELAEATRPLGYIVLTRFGPDWWRDDWDGEVHRDLDDGLTQLAQCRATNPDAVLVECNIVEQPVEVVDVWQ